MNKTDRALSFLVKSEIFLCFAHRIDKIRKLKIAPLGISEQYLAGRMYEISFIDSTKTVEALSLLLKSKTFAHFWSLNLLISKI